jgi:subtilisin family serine protease
MKRQLFALLLLLLFIFSPWTPPAAAQQDYVEGEILVRYKAGVSESVVAHSLSAKGAGRLGGVERLNIQFVRLPAGQGVKDALTEYRRDPDVLYAEPNYRVHALVTPNDTFFSEQWGLSNTGQTIGPSGNTESGVSGADILATLAWNDQTGSIGTVIAVLDTGMDLDHEDLAGHLWLNTDENPSNAIDDDDNGFVNDFQGWDFVNNDNNPDDDSSSSHGTHISGIIGAEGFNNLGVAGVNWTVQLMALKVLGADGSGTVEDIISAIGYALDNGAKVINASWALSPSRFSQSLYDAIQNAAASSVLFVTAAGNNGTTIGVEYPARYNLDNIIAVTATGLSDELTDFGTAEPAAVDAEDVDLGAPGHLIYSTYIEGTAAPNLSLTTNYFWSSGTSFATAFVSGVAGLLLSEQPALTADQIKARILNSVDAVLDTDIATKTVSGGRLNADRAIEDQKEIDAGTAFGDIPVIVPFGTGLNVGETREFSLNGDAASTWSSSNPAVGTTLRTGPNTALFTAVGAGVCTISANSGTYTSAPIYVRDIIVSSSDFLLSPGETSLFTATGGTAPYTWTSNNPSVVTVNPDTGVVKAEGGGTATVQASDARGFFGTSQAIQVQGAGTRSSGSGDKTCFIATAAFGSPLARHVRTLRAFRDRYLLTNAPGRAFVNFYYRHSPPLAEHVAESPLLRVVVRMLLMPVVLFASLLMKTGAPWGAVFTVWLLAAGGTILFYRRRIGKLPAA